MSMLNSARNFLRGRFEPALTFFVNKSFFNLMELMLIWYLYEKRV